MAALTPKVISQAKLQRYLELKAQESELASLREEILDLAVQRNLPVQPGRFSLIVNPVKGGPNTDWKSTAITLAEKLGRDKDDFVKEIVDKSPKKKDYYTIKISDRENPVV